MTTELTILEEREPTLVPQKALATRRTELSRRAMQYDITTIEDVFGVSIEFVPWEKMGREHLEYFIARLQERGLAPSTINRKVSTLRQLIKFAYYEGLIEERTYRMITEAQGVTGKRIGKGRAYTAAEVVELLEGIDTSTLQGKRDKALLALLFTTGMRRSELVKAKVVHLRTDVGRPVLVVMGKGNKERLVPLRADVKRLLDAWLASGRDLHPDAPLFTHVRKRDGEYLCPTPDKPLNTNGIYKLFQKYTDGELSPHDARRTFVTMALDSGSTYQQIASVTGHASVDMVSRYERRRDALVNSAVDSLDLPSLNGQE